MDENYWCEIRAERLVKINVIQGENDWHIRKTSAGVGGCGLRLPVKKWQVLG